MAATQVQRRRGTTAQNDAFTGAVGEITVDTQTHNLRVHDGVRAGGYRLIVRESTSAVPYYGTPQCKIIYDEQGLVTSAEPLIMSDIPDLSSLYATQAQLLTKVTANAAITGGTYAKITFDEKGLVTGGQDLAPEDIPDISDTYAKKIPVVTPPVAGGVWSLQANAINRINLTASATFALPSSATLNLGILNQIVVQLKMLDPQQISLGTTYYIGGVAPDLSQAGVYNIYYEWDNNENAWCVGAILKKEITSV